MSVTKRTCLCCGKKFKFCPNCNRENNGYSINFDTKECSELFNAVSAYNMKTSNSNAINKILLKYNIADFDKYNESISSLLYALFPNMTEKKKKVETPKPEKEVTTEEKEPDNTESSTKSRFSKKNKSYQKEVELSDETEKENKVDTGISEVE